MNHYEKGRHLPDLETMKRMAKELNVPLAYFFCESDDEAELLKIFSQMDSLQKTELLIDLKKKNSNQQ
jgi:transcriptional regulator with XRE-family HTH domain